MSEGIPTSEALVAVLRRLPVRKDLPVSLDSQALVLAMGLSIYKPIAAVTPLKPATRKQTISQLRRLEKALNQLDQTLAELSYPTTAALDQYRRSQSLEWTPSLPQAIRLYIAQSFPSLGEAALAVAEDLEAHGPETQRGRQRNQSIQPLMQLLADIFSAVTGEGPARHVDAYQYGRDVGIFAQFVSEIFDLAGIDHSAEHEARWAVDDFKKRHEPSK